MRLCACGCGQEIKRAPQARYATDNCRTRAGQRRYRKIHPVTETRSRPFVGLDGEGIDSDYILLACGNGEYIQNRKGLSTFDCLKFLVTRPKGSNDKIRPIYVWFAFDYDVNMILKDVPFRGRNSIEQLHTTNEIYWRGFHIRYIRRKILRIRYGKYVHTSYDVWGFFQSSFEKALTNWGLSTTELIHEGKQARASFRKWSLARIRAYNEDELKLLQNLCENLREATKPLDLPIQNWHGPAALAAAWLRKNKIREWNREPEKEMEAAISRAYFGGRIDTLGYGHIDPVYHYDIVSAYPSAIRNLPNLQKLTWKLCAGKDLPPYAGTEAPYLIEIEWEIPIGFWGVFPWRSRNGSIYWPPRGHGWYWNYELETALEKYPASCFNLKRSWVPEGKLEFPFRNLIEETFAYRAELKRQGNPSHVPIKLILNSLYGKFAQTVGKAQFYSLIWAGMITSQTRAQLGKFINDDTILVMTDGLWSAKHLPVPQGSNLGDWEYQDEDDLWVAGAGIYEASKPNGSTVTFQRGFDKANPVDIPEMVNHWLSDDPLYEPVYNVNRFVSCGLALQTHYPWRTWQQMQRKISPLPFSGTTKRYPFYPVDEDSDMDQRIGDFIRLYPRSVPVGEISYPYSKTILEPDSPHVLLRLQDDCYESAN